MTVLPFPHVRIEGGPRERGLLYGRQCSERIAKGEDIYRSALGARGFEWQAIKTLAREFRPAIHAVDPDYLTEIDAIAEGSGVDVEAVIVINARSELFNGRDPKGAEAIPEEGCTSALALGRATGSGRLIHGQNWDFNAECVHSSIVLEIIRDDAPSILTFVEAGGLARSGFNDCGISVTANNLECEQDAGRSGMPLSMIRRRILSSPTLAEAIGAVTSAPRAVSNNMTIAAATGDEAINLETTPDDVFLLWPGADGLYTHANHFQSPVANTIIQDKAKQGRTPCTYYRDRRVRTYLEAADPITIDTFRTAFADSFGTPFAVCRPPVRSRSGHWSASVASVVFDAAAGEMHVRPAPYDPLTQWATHRLSTVPSVATGTTKAAAE